MVYVNPCSFFHSLFYSLLYSSENFSTLAEINIAIDEYIVLLHSIVVVWLYFEIISHSVKSMLLRSKASELTTAWRYRYSIITSARVV